MEVIFCSFENTKNCLYSATSEKDPLSLAISKRILRDPVSKIGPDRPSIYTGPFWTRFETVLDQFSSRFNTWIGSFPHHLLNFSLETSEISWQEHPRGGTISQCCGG